MYPIQFELTSPPMLQVTLDLVRCKDEITSLLPVVKVEDPECGIKQEQKVIYNNVLQYYSTLSILIHLFY